VHIYKRKKKAYLAQLKGGKGGLWDQGGIQTDALRKRRPPHKQRGSEKLKTKKKRVAGVGKEGVPEKKRSQNRAATRDKSS